MRKEPHKKLTQLEIIRRSKRFGIGYTGVSAEHPFSRIRNLAWTSIPVSYLRAGSVRKKTSA